MISIKEYMRATNSAIRQISKILEKEHYNYFLGYSGRSIEILSKDENEYTRLYLKTVYTGYGFALDFSNIELDERIRHKGIFTSIINETKKSRIISEIWISSVLTPEMHAACKKLGFEVFEQIQGYKYKIKNIHSDL